MGRLLTTMLFGVEPLDPATFAFVAIVLLLTAAVSAPVPRGARPASIRRWRCETNDATLNSRRRYSTRSAAEGSMRAVRSDGSSAATIVLTRTIAVPMT